MRLRNDGSARQARPDKQDVRLLIVEQGAENVAAHLSPTAGDDLIVLRQLEGETSIDLVVRTCARISSLEYVGKSIRQTVIALSPTVDPLLNETRSMLGLMILSHVNAMANDSELILGLGQNATKALRQEVEDLVESLVAHPGSRRAPIRVRFSAERNVEPSPPPRSGIHARPARAAG